MVFFFGGFFLLFFIWLSNVKVVFIYIYFYIDILDDVVVWYFYIYYLRVYRVIFKIEEVCFELDYYYIRICTKLVMYICMLCIYIYTSIYTL